MRIVVRVSALLLVLAGLVALLQVRLSSTGGRAVTSLALPAAPVQVVPPKRLLRGVELAGYNHPLAAVMFGGVSQGEEAYNEQLAIAACMKQRGWTFNVSDAYRAEIEPATSAELRTFRSVVGFAADASTDKSATAGAPADPSQLAKWQEDMTGGEVSGEIAPATGSCEYLGVQSVQAGTPLGDPAAKEYLGTLSAQLVADPSLATALAAFVRCMGVAGYDVSDVTSAHRYGKSLVGAARTKYGAAFFECEQSQIIAVTRPLELSLVESFASRFPSFAPALATS